MESLLGYGSDTDSSSDRDVSEHAPAAKRSKRSNATDFSPATAADSKPDAPHQQQQKNTSLLPSAADLLDGSYSPPPAAQQRQLEQAVLHQGRSRVFPHVPGNFATHVYIEVRTPPGCLTALNALLQALRCHLPSLQPVVHGPSGMSGDGMSHGSCCPPAAGHPATAPAASLAAQPVYHVSLSRTVPLLLHQVEPLVESLRRRLRQQDTFCIRMGRPEVLVNDEGSRTFLAIAAGGSSQHGAARANGCVAAPGSGGGKQQQQQQQEQQEKQAQQAQQEEQEEQVQQAQQQQGQQAQHARQQEQQYSPQLVALCHAVSSVFASHGLPRFYADPRPHASVAWLLGSEQQLVEAALAQPEVQAAAVQLEAQVWQLVPAAIVCKAGQRGHTVWQAADSGGHA